MKGLAPKPRSSIDLQFYTTGESKFSPSPTSLSKHKAEPGEAASLMQRNPHLSNPQPLKLAVHAPSVQDRYDPAIASLATMKQVQSREYAQ
jgi:hypothetical protein